MNFCRLFATSHSLLAFGKEEGGGGGRGGGARPCPQPSGSAVTHPAREVWWAASQWGLQQRGRQAWAAARGHGGAPAASLAECCCLAAAGLNPGPPLEEWADRSPAGGPGPHWSPWLRGENSPERPAVKIHMENAGKMSSYYLYFLSQRQHSSLEPWLLLFSVPVQKKFSSVSIAVWNQGRVSL